MSKYAQVLDSLITGIVVLDSKLNIEMINTSEVRVNVVVDDSQGQAGLKALNKAFADVIQSGG